VGIEQKPSQKDARGALHQGLTSGLGKRKMSRVGGAGKKTLCEIQPDSMVPHNAPKGRTAEAEPVRGEYKPL